MALVFPDIEKKRVIFPSRAEKQLYDTLHKLPNSWSVYYSCTLSSLDPEKGLQDNEIDFVLYHPKYGLFVIEVKGGGISFDAELGQFFSMNRHGKSFPIKDPFQQALVWKSRFLRMLKQRKIKVPATHLVCFPTVNENEIRASASVQQELVIGRARLANVEEYLRQICRKVHPEKYLDFSDVREELNGILKGSTYTTRLHLRDYIDNHELKVKDIEHIHETLISPIASVKRLAVEGEAGTGKTILAMMLAKKFRDEGKSVLLLSSNPLLNSFMKKETGQDVDVETYWDLASTYGIELLRRPSGFEGSRDDWIQYVGPEVLKEKILSSDRRYDVLLCDEAQDVQPFWWESLEAVLKNKDSHFYIFFDRSQGVFGSGSSDNSFVPEDVLPISSPYFPLIHNYRTTREIGAFSQSFRTGSEILRSHSARLGYFPQVIVYENESDAAEKLGLLLKKLVEREYVKNSEITILSGRRPFHDGSWLKGADIQGFDLLDLASLKQRKLPKPQQLQGKIPVSTIASFKGLETTVGIVTNLSEYNLPFSNPIMASLFYVACTRAKHMLYIMVKKGDAKHKAIVEALDAIDHQGAMVIDQSSSDTVMEGRVVYYDPDRFGWIKVEDPTYKGGHIMFFPHDIKKSGYHRLRVNDSLRFATRVEGYTTVAYNVSMPDVSEHLDQPELGRPKAVIKAL
jgi:hypothetical protein